MSFRRNQHAVAADDGAVAIIVAVFIAVVVLGVSALAIDGGALLRSQRALATDTDAMALAGARVLGLYPDCTSPGARTAVLNVIDSVASDNGVVDYEVEPFLCPGRQRLVTVRARESSPGWFSGRDDLSAVNVTTADGGSLAFSDLAVCRNFVDQGLGFVDLEDFEISPPAGIWTGPPALAPEWGSPGVVNIPYGGPHPEEVEARFCNDDPAGSPTIPGGWGWLEKGRSFVNGIPFECIDEDGDNWCQSDTGTNLMNRWPIDSGEPFEFPVFDDARGQGSGGQFRIIGIAQAVFIGCSGSASGLAEDEVYEGSCGGNPTWLSMQLFGFEPISNLAHIEDVAFRIVPPPRICGVRATDGECVGF